ncbi:hypothetical protein [Rummeliibacillus suwonensis]|uniref:hypothetical protein n=1 Tax=Rummeliibacillus suwonensis TaxID=1306154 RepID=UPI00164537CF|nr:hypothetical protein [Rummeliibacillus suwonensis]
MDFILFIPLERTVRPPPQDLEKNEKIDGGSARINPIGSGGQAVGHSGVSTGRGALT